MWMTKLLHSFRFALEGLKYTIVSQRNMRIHFIVALLVLTLSLYLPLSKIEILIIFLTITLVLFAELLNTSVEKIIDLITEEYHPVAKVVKDVTAGAVLLTAGLAVIVGISIFYPYVNADFLYLLDNPSHTPRIGLAAIVAFDFFLTLLLKGWLYLLGKVGWEPSMITSIAVCVAILIVVVIGNLIISLLVFLLLAMLIALRYRLNPNRIAIIFGALLGTVVSIIGVQIL